MAGVGLLVSIHREGADRVDRHLHHLLFCHECLLSHSLTGCLLPRIKSHEIEAQDPHLQRLMVSSKNRVGQIIKTLVTVVTFIALTSWFHVIKATLNNLFRLTRGTRDAIRPT